MVVNLLSNKSIGSLAHVVDARGLLFDKVYVLKGNKVQLRWNPHNGVK